MEATPSRFNRQVVVLLAVLTGWLAVENSLRAEMLVHVLAEENENLDRMIQAREHPPGTTADRTPPTTIRSFTETELVVDREEAEENPEPLNSPQLQGLQALATVLAFFPPIYPKPQNFQAFAANVPLAPIRDTRTPPDDPFRPPDPPVTVPEPTSLITGLIGIVGCGWMTYRRRRQASQVEAVE